MTTAAESKDKAVAAKRKTLPELLNDPATAKRFQDMLGRDARSFTQNILTVFNQGQLAGCEPESIISAAAISASINLSILPSLGHSCLVPYKDKDGALVAQWQIMWKGLIQLFHRSGQCKKINLAHVYEGELVAYDKFKAVIILDEKKKKSGRVQGYYFYFELHTGGLFEFYWSAKECIEHGLRYSKSFQKGLGKWTEDPEFEAAGSVKKWLAQKDGQHFLTEGSGADAMSAKSIVKNETNTWAPLETRIKEIVQANDQAVIGADGQPVYIDAVAESAGAGKTYTPPPQLEKGKEPAPAEKLAWARDAAKKQGVPHDQFDAWVAEQPGDEAAKATAAELAWKKVAAKQAKAVDVFALKAAAPAEKSASFKVYGVATADVDGNPDCFCIRDTSEPATKYYTDSPEVAEAARSAKASGEELAAKFVEKVVGSKTILWITKTS